MLIESIIEKTVELQGFRIESVTQSSLELLETRLFLSDKSLVTQASKLTRRAIKKIINYGEA